MQLQKIAEEGLKLYFLAVPFVGFNIVSAMFFTSTERALPAQMISVLRGLVVIIPAAFILSAVFEMQGVWLSYPVTEGIVTIFAVCVLLKNAGRKPGYRKSLNIYTEMTCPMKTWEGKEEIDLLFLFQIQKNTTDKKLPGSR